MLKDEHTGYKTSIYVYRLQDKQTGYMRSIWAAGQAG
jgi:hypothetical protein